MLKKDEEISLIKKQHKDEMATMERKMDGLMLLMKNMFKVQHPDLDEEDISSMFAAAVGNGHSATPRSSASTYVPHEKVYEFIFIFLSLHYHNLCCCFEVSYSLILVSFC
jgi:hypothetical protein